jgi:hypothetical protein
MARKNRSDKASILPGKTNHGTHQIFDRNPENQTIHDHKTGYSKGWFRKNHLVLLSLVIALFGGLPGATSVYNMFASKAKLSVTLDLWTVFDDVSPKGHPRKCLFMGLTISNSGSKPLNPKGYLISAKLSDTTIAFIPELLPDTVFVASDIYQIDLPKGLSKYDIERMHGILQPFESVSGFLWATTPLLIDSLQQKISEFQNTCVDNLDKRYTANVKSYINYVKDYAALPWLNVNIQSKSSK